MFVSHLCVFFGELFSSLADFLIGSFFFSLVFVFVIELYEPFVYIGPCPVELFADIFS